MAEAGSPSIQAPEYWWYRARADLLQVALAERVGSPRRVLDVGSADGPSVGWLRGRGQRVALDIDPRGLEKGDVCGSATALPFDDGAFDVVAAFDVIEHCEPRGRRARRDLAGAGTRRAPPAVGAGLSVGVDALRRPQSALPPLHPGARVRRDAGAQRVRDPERRPTCSPAPSPSSLPIAWRTRLREAGTPGSDPGPGRGARAALDEPGPGELMLPTASVDRKLLRAWDLPFGSSVVAAGRKPGPRRFRRRRECAHRADRAHDLGGRPGLSRRGAACPELRRRALEAYASGHRTSRRTSWPG